MRFVVRLGRAVRLLTPLAAGLIVAAGCTRRAPSEAGAARASGYPPVTIKFADPGNQGVMAFARKDGRLARELAKVNARIEWVPGAHAFSANFEAMNTGAINTSGAAVSPIIGALSHNLQFKIFTIADPPTSKSAGIVVPRGSGVRTLADLVGKRVAVNQAAHGEYVLLKALAQAGIPADKVQRVPIQPPEAAAAFATGKIDAWSTFGVFFLTAVKNGARVLTSVSDVQSDDVTVTAANVALLERNPAAFQVFLRVYQELLREAHQAPEKFQNVFTTQGPTAVHGELLRVATEETRLLPVQRVPTAADRVRVGNVARLFFDHGTIDRLVPVDEIVFDVDAAARVKGYPLSASLVP